VSELVNELTGESMSVEDYVVQNRAIERRIGRLDNTIADLKATLKQTKGERDKEVSALRSSVRETKMAMRAERASTRRPAKLGPKS
jgi:hypothetical protein